MASPGNEVPEFELIRRMADRGSAPELARQAWAELFRRHYPFMLKVAIGAHGRLMGSALVEDAVKDAFLKAYLRAETFISDETQVSGDQGRKFRAWVSRIINNNIKDSFRGEPEFVIFDEEKSELLTFEPNDDNFVGEELAAVEQCLALLTETEQTVLRATMMFRADGSSRHHIPRSAMMQLVAQTGKQPENIRQIRFRALGKLKKLVNEKLGRQ